MKKNNIPVPDPAASVLFATFSAWENGKRLPTNGSVEPMRDYLVPRIEKLVIIDQLVPGTDDVLPKYEVYTGHKNIPVIGSVPFTLRVLEPLLRLCNSKGTNVLFKIRDFISVVDWALHDSTLFEYFIGLESVNAIAGVVLRKLGRVKNVVYYVSDYSPNRYANTLFNAVYLWLDRFAAMHSDYIWDVSPAMQPARIAAGLDPKKSAQVVRVGNGLFPDQISIASVSHIRRHDIAYMGTVGAENGPDVIIRALAIIRKIYPDAILHIIGGNIKDFEWLTPIIQELGLTHAVIHYGFVPKSADMAAIMRKCAIGVAPYRAILGSPRYYGDAGKIRAYSAVGLAIVCSPVPPLGREFAKKNAALVVRDTPEAFATAIKKIFSTKTLYNTLRRNAVQVARSNTWDNQFENAFSTMEEHL